MYLLRRGVAPVVALAASHVQASSSAREPSKPNNASTPGLNPGSGCPRRCAVEVCLGDVPSVVVAVRGGASRVELCDSLSDGGTTPSLGAILGAVEACRGTSTKVMVLIRPRAGDFCYAPAEVRCMERDVALARAAGVHGVVVGALLPSGAVDAEALARLVAAAKGPLRKEEANAVPEGGAPAGSSTGTATARRCDAIPSAADVLSTALSHTAPVSVTFHRAFAVCSDPLVSPRLAEPTLELAVCHGAIAGLG